MPTVSVWLLPVRESATEADLGAVPLLEHAMTTTTTGTSIVKRIGVAGKNVWKYHAAQRHATISKRELVEDAERFEVGVAQLELFAVPAGHDVVGVR
jgi:hypothetical protein